MTLFSGQAVPIYGVGKVLNHALGPLKHLAETVLGGGVATIG
jgi:hypothetical protein